MKQGMEEVLRRFKEKTLKKCYKIELLDEEPKLTDSKLGGIPYLPKDKNYPRDKWRERMPLLMQINLSEISIENYPTKGLLQLYVEKELLFPTDYKLLYFEDIEEEYNDNLPEINLDKFILKEPIKIKLEPNETYMPLGDYRFDKVFSEIFNDVFKSDVTCIFDIDEVLQTENEYDAFLEQLEIEPGLIGGYADFTQTDPRTFGRQNLEECIIKLDSQLDPDRIIIGDSGILKVLMTKKDLINKRFDKAKFEWDCC